MQFKSILSVSTVLIITAASQAGGPHTWDGSSSTDWFTAANWDTNQVPGTGDAVIIPNVTTDPIVNADTATIGDLTIQSGGVLTVSGAGTDLTASGTLSVSGTLSITARAEFTGAASHVVANGGIVDVRGEIDFSNASATLALNSGSSFLVKGSATNDIAATMSVSTTDFDFTGNGTINHTGPVTINSGGEFNLDAPTTGTGTVNIDAAYTVASGGEFDINDNGAVNIDAAFDLSGTFNVDDTATVTMEPGSDYAVLSGGLFDINAAGTVNIDEDFTVASGGTFDVDAAAAVNVDGSGVVFDLEGTFLLDAASATLAVTNLAVFDVEGLLDINAAGTLTLDDGGVMELDATLNFDASPTVTIGDDARIDMDLAASQMNVNQNVTIGSTDDGYVRPLHPDAQITIASTKTLTMTAPLQGHLTIDGSGTYNNNNRMSAQNGVLTLANTLNLTDSSGKLWETISGSSAATIAFNKAHAGLAGDFSLEGCGFFIFNVDITTSGSFVPATSNGSIDCDPTDFVYSGGSVLVDTVYGGC